MPNALQSRLAAGETVEAKLDPGTYDFDIWDCQGNKLKSVTSYKLTEPLTWNLSETPAGSSTGTLYINIVNQRSYNFCEFYISPAGSGAWGENRLFPDYGFIITSNSSYLEWIEPGTYDLMLKDCSGNVAAQKFNLTIPSNMTWTLTP